MLAPLDTTHIIVFSCYSLYTFKMFIFHDNYSILASYLTLFNASKLWGGSHWGVWKQACPFLLIPQIGPKIALKRAGDDKHAPFPSLTYPSWSRLQLINEARQTLYLLLHLWHCCPPPLPVSWQHNHIPIQSLGDRESVPLNVFTQPWEIIRTRLR